MEDLASAIDATTTGIIYQDMLALKASFGIAARMDPECELQYLAYYSAFDPYRSASLARLTSVGPESVYVGEQLIERDWLRKTEYYNDFLAAQDIVHHMCAPLTHGRRWGFNLSCHRPRKRSHSERTNLISCGFCALIFSVRRNFESGIKIEDFRIDNVPERVRRTGDLFHPLLLVRRRVRLEQFL